MEAFSYHFTENYDLDLMILSALRSFIVSFSSLFSCATQHFTLLFWFTLVRSLAATDSYFLERKLLKSTLHYPIGTKH